MQVKNDAVRKPSAAVAAMQDDWQLVAALMGGTKAMRAAGPTYLPKWPAEDGPSYAARLATATLFPAYQRTVEVLSAKPFSKPMTVDKDVPTELQALFENIDLQGRNLDVFAADVAAEAMAYGMAGILVDVPVAEGVRTRADEKQRGIRPYFVQIHPGNILGWKAQIDGGEWKLIQLRLLEQCLEEDGEFGEKLVEQVKVYTPGAWQAWRKRQSADGEEWFVHQEGITTYSGIPFVPVYGKRTGFMTSTPPMLELAHANIEHWQSKSDQQSILHVARVPLLFGRQLGQGAIVVGAGSLVSSDAEHADLRYVEHSGAAIEAGRKSLLDLEDRMRQIGAELLVIKPGNITESQTLADNEPGMCALQRITQHLENAIDQALAVAAEWIGITHAGHISLFSDFGAATLAEAHAELLFNMEAGGSLTLETLLNELKRRGILSPDVNVTQEIAKAAALPKPAKSELIT